MFNGTRNSSGHLELFIEFAHVKVSEISLVIDYGVGTYAEVEYMSFILV